MSGTYNAKRKTKGTKRASLKFEIISPNKTRTEEATDVSNSIIIEEEFGQNIKRCKKKRFSVSTPNHIHMSSTHSTTPLQSTTSRSTESIENQPAPTLYQTPPLNETSTFHQTPPHNKSLSPTLHQTPCEDSAPNSLPLVSTPNSNYIVESHKMSPTDVAVVDDLMFGLCPEDLSFSFNNSNTSFQKPVSETGMTTVIQKMTSPSRVTDKSKIILEDAPDSIAHSRPTKTSNNSTCISVTCSLGYNSLSYPSGTFYGLPLTVSMCLKEHRGIEKLYDWQDTCLTLPSVIAGHNLIYSLPTSGGKTLVAEILMLQQIIVKKKNVIFILPFVSIVQEKVRELMPFAETLGFAIEEYAASKGRLPPIKRRNQNVLYVATIEKANALVNSFIELQRLKSIGLIVVDELHMVGEGGTRGATLEGCLAKILFADDSVQVIGMSATLNNLSEVAQFLKAKLYSNDFRPVELKEYVKIGCCIYSIEINEDNVHYIPTRDILDSANNNAVEDQDQLSSLVLEVIPLSSCLVFCPTKKNCENVALMLCKCLPRSLQDVKRKERKTLMQLLHIEAAGLCPILAQTIPMGIAYHHSGLTADERRLLEEAYLVGTLYIITCTSTLAAGVNLPAKRVILRSPYVGQHFISCSQYKQMVGRAGRSGLCQSGESILIVQPHDKDKVSSLLSSHCDSCHSSLLSNNMESLNTLFLSLIVLKLITSYNDVQPFLECTLLYHQHNDCTALLQSCHDSLSSLISSQYIINKTIHHEPNKPMCHAKEWPDSQQLCATAMGKAIHKGCLNVSLAHTVYNDLLTAQQSLVLTSDLHLLTLVIPHDLIKITTPNWVIFYDLMTRFSADEYKVTEILKINTVNLHKKSLGMARKMSENEAITYTKFYISLILHRLLKTQDSDGVWLVADLFNCSRGFIQSVLQQTSSFASCLVHFTEELPELWPLKALLPSIVQKLSYSVTIDLLPLIEIPGIKQGRVRQLIAAGIKTPQDLVSHSPKELCEKIEHLFPGQAGKLIKSAKLLLAEKAELLQDEAQELLDLVPKEM